MFSHAPIRSVGRPLFDTTRRRIVLRHTTATLVDEARIVLSEAVALIGEGPPQVGRCRMVTAPIGSEPVLEWPST